MASLKTSLTLELNDRLTAPLKKVSDSVSKLTKV